MASECQHCHQWSQGSRAISDMGQWNQRPVYPRSQALFVWCLVSASWSLRSVYVSQLLLHSPGHVTHSQPGRICRYDVLLTSLTIYIWTFIELLLGVKFVILYSSSLFAESVFQEVLLCASCKAFPRGLNLKEKICVFKLLFGNCSRFPSTIVINGARVWNLEAAGTLLRLR